MGFDQHKYINEYNKTRYKMYQFRVRNDDEELIEYLDSKNKRNSYIISLIDKDMKRKNILSIKEIKDRIVPVLHKYGISDIYLFGSYGRGEASPDSDVDILCDKGNIRTLIDQGEMEEELEASLNKSVDIVFTSSVKDEYFEKQIMEDRIKLC